ncbi:TPA: hypothetical protein WI157_001667 [Neisseria meningitidis]|nr:hypothetical protein [Neisseria meningitidis]MBH2282341.1 hypothetical protein [Neisseria meningitidis]MBH2355786.1 hypothetical protein [Neisseria meningitidis]MBH6061650.1 hypothetical protein [Neisseria meningitidis]MBW3885326.1 hypothetical protein [Neisseria meningitidis]MBW3901916.1 hypothetical protein [Neisseria meningitidis]
MHQRQCGFVGEQDLQLAVGQDFFDRMTAYGVSDGIFTEQAGRDVLPVLR